MTRWLLAALALLIGCDAAPVSPPPLSECAVADYPAWQTSDYVLPYPAGRAYLVLQGSCGGFSHTAGSTIAFAVDFRMPIGEAVTAMRGGTVSQVEESYADFDNVRGHENGVVVDHGDGTLGVYLHFTGEGADVEVGDTVVQGDTLGRSGHTGFSTEPHLHIDVRRGCPDTCASVPITFRNTSANPRGLVGGIPYLAHAP
ncbi:M23 family metallopeptidase [Rubrivirga sp. IMCC43871]|uniref:M23 family metallopeptidase n=1 Tax=Rubrivirga sp. IMCC43871 TaxID=3391575 RepID=UPI00398FD5A7